MARTPLILVAATAAVLTASCAQQDPSEKDPNAQKVADAAANPTFSVAQAAPAPILALQLLVTPAGATVQNAQFMRAPLRKSGGEADMMVIGMTGGRIVHKYTIADPLNAQVEPNDKGLHETVRQPQAAVWVYMPATRIDVIELSPGRDDDTLPRGARIDMTAVYGRLCGRVPRIEDCAERVLAATPTQPGGPTTGPGTVAGPGIAGPGVVAPGTAVQSPTLPLPPPKRDRPT